jgi:hypothetical protein
MEAKGRRRVLNPRRNIISYIGAPQERPGLEHDVERGLVGDAAVDLQARDRFLSSRDAVAIQALAVVGAQDRGAAAAKDDVAAHSVPESPVGPVARRPRPPRAAVCGREICGHRACAPKSRCRCAHRHRHALRRQRPMRSTRAALSQWHGNCAGLGRKRPVL